MNLETVFLSIEIQTSGSNYNENGIICIGYCAGLRTGNILLKKRISLVLPENRGFDKKYLTDFWNIHSDVLNTLSIEAVRIKEGLTEFINDVDNLDNLYNVVIISDNTIHTIGFINHYLITYLNRLPLYYKYGVSSNIRRMIDIYSFSRGVLRLCNHSTNTDWSADNIDKILKLKYLDDKDKKSYYPDSIAEYNYNKYVQMMYYLNDN